MRIERYGKTRYWAVIDADGSLGYPLKTGQSGVGRVR